MPLYDSKPYSEINHHFMANAKKVYQSGYRFLVICCFCFCLRFTISLKRDEEMLSDPEASIQNDKIYISAWICIKVPTEISSAF